MGLLIYVIILALYLIMPLPVQLIVCIGNFLIPDAIPVVDELVMIVGLMKKLASLSEILNWLDKHNISLKMVIVFVLLLGGALVFLFIFFDVGTIISDFINSIFSIQNTSQPM